jgi:hypothetical protein
VSKIGRNVPPPRDKDAPKLLVTKFGAMADDSSLPDHLDQEFINWIKNFRASHPTVSLPDTREELIIFWKHQISKEYADKAFSLSDKVP